MKKLTKKQKIKFLKHYINSKSTNYLCFEFADFFNIKDSYTIKECADLFPELFKPLIGREEVYSMDWGKNISGGVFKTERLRINHVKETLKQLIHHDN